MKNIHFMDARCDVAYFLVACRVFCAS